MICFFFVFFIKGVDICLRGVWGGVSIGIGVINWFVLKIDEVVKEENEGWKLLGCYLILKWGR